MQKTKGYAATAVKAPLGPFAFERRDLRENDVAIEIKYCGICHSDIHQVRDEWGGSIFPMVPGHEIAGIVTAVGGKVTKYKIGDRVGVGCFVDSCGHCPECKKGLEQYCATGVVLTYNAKEYDGTPTMGGYSDKIVVKDSYVLRMPDNLPLEGCAPLLCAGITLYSPLKHWKAGPGKQVAIVGLGGLGHMGVKIAHALGAEVTVLSQSLRKQADGKRLGADHFYATVRSGDVQEIAAALRSDRQHGFGRHRLEPISASAERGRNDGGGGRAREASASDRSLLVDPGPKEPGRFGDRRHSGDAGDARLLRQAQPDIGR